VEPAERTVARAERTVAFVERAVAFVEPGAEQLAFEQQ
jgi:hypothetical protein